MYINEVKTAKPRDIETIAIGPAHGIFATCFYEYKTKNMVPLCVSITSHLIDGKVNELKWIMMSRAGSYFEQTDKYGASGGSMVVFMQDPETAATAYVQSHEKFFSFENAFPMIQVIKEENND